MTFGTSQAVYDDALPYFVGGYTVAGNAMSRDGLSSFSVQQECLCECNATSTGIFCRGANDDNAFNIVLARDAIDGTWQGQQVSVGVEPAYQASMDFAHVPGGKHTAMGYRLCPTTTSTPGAGQTLFRAHQSEIGCNQGVGARRCEVVCGRVGLPWEQIRARCG